jgi:Mlc titration factor MtfA (ptsG expression regulator)
VLARTIYPDEIVTAQLWEKEQELLEEKRMEERSQTENNLF